MLEPAPPQITWLLPRSPAMIPEKTRFVGSDDLLTAPGMAEQGCGDEEAEGSAPRGGLASLPLRQRYLPSLREAESSSLTFSPSFVNGISPAFIAACPTQFLSLLWKDLSRAEGFPAPLAPSPQHCPPSA